MKISIEASNRWAGAKDCVILFIGFSVVSCAIVAGCNKTDQANEAIEKMNEQTKRSNEQRVAQSKQVLEYINSRLWPELVKATSDGDPQHIATAKKQFLDSPETASKQLMDLFSEPDKADNIELRVAINLAPEFVANTKDAVLSESIIEPLFLLRYSGQPAEIQKLVEVSFEQCAELAINNGTKNPMIFVARGLLHFERKQHESALSDFGKAISLDSEIEAAYTGRSNIYIVNNEFAKAVEDLNRSIEINPESFQTRYMRSACFVELENLENALNDASVSIELNSEFVEARMLRAKIYQALGQTEKANADLKTAQEIETKKHDN